MNKTGVGTQACNRIFVETLVERQTQPVAHGEQAVLVVQRVARQVVVVVEILPFVIGNHPAAVTAQLKRVEYARHRHKHIVGVG